LCALSAHRLDFCSLAIPAVQGVGMAAREVLTGARHRVMASSTGTRP
jgi:hypothetical protein